MTMPVRVQLSRKRGWKMPPNTVSVARPGPWGNPYAVGKPYFKRDETTRFVRSRMQAWYLFDRAVKGELPNDYLYADAQAWQLFVARVKRELRGKNLACWCPLSSPCHADVLLRIANAAPSARKEGECER